MKHLLISIPFGLIFFFLSLFAGIFEESFLFQTVAIVACSILLIPAYFDKLPGKWSVIRKLRTHFIFSLSVIMLLNLGYTFRSGVKKENAFNYRFGHLSGPFRVLYSTPPFQFVIGKIYRFAPLRNRISIFQFEDVARIKSIQKEVNEDFSRSLLCGNRDEANCFLNILRATVKAHPPGTAGILAIYEDGTDILRMGKGLHEKEGTELLRLVTSLSDRPETEIQHFVPGFPEFTGDLDLQRILKGDHKVRYILAHQTEGGKDSGKEIH